MKTINQDIKNGTIRQFYLLYGEEVYLKHQYRDKLVAALIDPEDTMNYSYFEGNKVNVENIVETGMTLPFFAERRVMVLENTGLFKKAVEGFEDQLEAMPDTTFVIFVENEVDGKRKLFRWFKQHGYISEMSTPKEGMLISWVKGLCNAEGKQIEDSVVGYLVQHMGTDMYLLKNELEKLFSYIGERETITIEDVAEICVSQATDTLFDMLDAIGSRNRERALMLYHDLLALKEPPIRTLTLMTRHYRILAEVLQLSQEDKNYKEIGSLVGVPHFFVGKYAKQAQSYSYEQLLQMLEKCQNTDQGIKTGRIQDVIGVELLIVEFSGL